MYEKTTLRMVRSRFLAAFLSEAAVVSFLYLQDFLIDAQYKGQGISYHVWLFKLMLDIPITFFTWSYYRRKYEMEQGEL